MTVSSTTSKDQYTGNGSLDTYAFTFSILDETHLLVQFKDSAGAFTTKVLTTDYTVNGTGNTTGNTDYTSGNVVFESGDIPAATDEVVISRAVPLLQGTDYPENGVFPANSHEQALDELTMIAQQIDEEVDRSLKLDIAVTGVSGTMPDPVASEFLRWNASANAIESQALSVSSGLADVVDDTSPQLGGDLDINAHNILCDSGNGIYDDDNNQQLIFNKVASAVNHLVVSNGGTAAAPFLASEGDDTDISLNLVPKGAGDVQIAGGLAVTEDIIHIGDINNKVSFTTDTQTFTTGGTSRLDITDSGVRLGTGARATTILDEDAMGTDSATALATQQSIKAYVDTQVTAAEGSMYFLASATASASSEIVFESIISSTYDEFVVICNSIVPGTDNQALYLRTSTDNGGDYNGGADYDFSQVGINSAATSLSANGAGANVIAIASGANLGTGTGESCNVILRIKNPSNASASTVIAYETTGTDQAGNGYAIYGSGMRIAAADVDAIRFFMGTGTIASGEFKIYGIKKS